MAVTIAACPHSPPETIRASAAAGWPLLGPACAAALLSGCAGCLLLPGLPAWPWLLGLALVGVVLAWQRDWRRVLGVMSLGAAYAGWMATLVLAAQWPAARNGEQVWISGQIVDLPVQEARRTRFLFEVDATPAMPPQLRGQRLRLAWYQDRGGPRPALQAGSRWQLHVRLRAPQGLRNPGGSDSERFALMNRLVATGSVQSPAEARRLAAPAGVVAWRETMSARIAAAVPSPAARYVQALALGDTRGLDTTDWARLRAAGLTHLIAISGFHVGLVAGFGALLVAALWWLWPGLCRWLPRPLAAGVGAVIGAFGYAALTGMAVPTLRTAVMITVLVLARWLRRRLRLVDALALACITLLVLDPLALLGAGFWLSFAGVAWLLWCLPEGDGPGLSGMLRGFLAAQAVASLGLLPLCVMLFGQASLLGPLANLAAVPWWSLVVVPLSLLGVLADTLHAGWGVLFWRLAADSFDLLWPALTWLADSPLALVWLPQARAYAVPLALLGAFWLLLPHGLPGRWLGLLLWLPLLLPPRELPRQGEVELLVVDVGQGLAVLVRTAGHTLLYDMGPALEDGFDAGEQAVVPALHALGVRRLDLAIISHADNDHAGGRDAVHAAFPLPQVLAPDGSPLPQTRPCLAGQSWQWDGVTFRILHPTRWFPYLGNESACVVQIEARSGRALLAGDIGGFVERRLLATMPQALRADVVLVPHHGSAGSSTPEFVAATGARLALVSSGADNRFRHPRPEVVRRWCQAGAEVLDTARSGALRVWLGAQGLAVREQRSAQARIWDAVRRRGQAAGLCYAPEFMRP